MRNKNKNVENHEEDIPHEMPMRHKMRNPRHRHPYMMHKMRKFARDGPMPFMRRDFRRNPMLEFEEIESKEEAIEVLELQIKRLQKHRNRTERRLKRFDSIEDHIEETIAEIGKMKEFSQNEFKSILRKKRRNFEMKMLEEED